MSGAPAAFDQLVENLVMGGKIAMLRIPLGPRPSDWTKLVFKMLTVKGIYGREMFETWHKMLAMLESGLKIRKIITHRLPIVEFKTGFEIMRIGNCGKIVLDWNA
jgi:threonine 3-dehydrogenase